MSRASGVFMFLAVASIVLGFLFTGGSFVYGLLCDWECAVPPTVYGIPVGLMVAVIFVGSGALASFLE